MILPFITQNFIIISDDFAIFYPQSQEIINNTDLEDPIYHLKTIKLIEVLKEYFDENNYFYSLIGDEGSDGVYAAEMYRMITLLVVQTDICDNVIYEGEYKYGKVKFKGSIKMSKHFFYGARRYEKGKLYYKSGKLRYEGTFAGYKTFEFKKGIEYKYDGTVMRIWNE